MATTKLYMQAERKNKKKSKINIREKPRQLECENLDSPSYLPDGFSITQQRFCYWGKSTCFFS